MSDKVGYGLLGFVTWVSIVESCTKLKGSSDCTWLTLHLCCKFQACRFSPSAVPPVPDMCFRRSGCGSSEVATCQLSVHSWDNFWPLNDEISRKQRKHKETSTALIYLRGTQFLDKPRSMMINVAERYGFVIDIRDLMGQSSSDVTKCHLKELFNFAAWRILWLLAVLLCLLQPAVLLCLNVISDFCPSLDCRLPIHLSSTSSPIFYDEYRSLRPSNRRRVLMLAASQKSDLSGSHTVWTWFQIFCVDTRFLTNNQQINETCDMQDTYL